jgi:hypothetical protein
VQTARFGGHRLPVAAWQAGIVWIDAIRAGCAVIALNSYDLGANGGSHRHEGKRRHTGH